MVLSTWSDRLVINQLNSGSKWTSSLISFAFPTAASKITTSSGEGEGFRALNASQQDVAELSLTTWDDLIRQDFFKVTTRSDIEYGMSNTGVEYAHAYYPRAGSVWFNYSYNDLANPVIGDRGFETYIHETGHALGLDHMGDYNGEGDWTPSCYQDSNVFTVMSYFGPSEQQGEGQVAWADWVGADGVLYAPQTPMLNDIMAIQTMYGIESTRTDDTVYGFNTNIRGSLASIYDFGQNAHPILCIYDSAGIDTLDLSGWSTDSVISLVDGSFSDCNSMTKNISIARNVVIENAITGGGRDSITGNTASNILNGGAGNDQVTGGAGNDTLIGGTGNDTAIYSGSVNNYQIKYENSQITVTDLTGTEGVDELNQIESIKFGRATWDIETYQGSAELDTLSVAGHWVDYQISTSGDQAALIDLNGDHTLQLLDSIERVQFSDARLALDIGIGQNAGEAYRLYQAAFDRTPDLAGLGYWINQIDQGVDLTSIAGSFMVQKEFIDMYGTAPTNQTFLTLLYNHVFDRDPDIEGYNYWQNQIGNGLSRSKVLTLFSESYENVENVQLETATGIQYKIWE